MTHISILLTFLYLTVAILLLVLCLATAWKRWIKLVMILVVTASYFVANYTFEDMLGWPTPRMLPEKFIVISAVIEEPNPAKGIDGAIYLWVSALDAQRPATVPRAYKLPYLKENHSELTESLRRSRQGIRQIAVIEGSGGGSGGSWLKMNTEKKVKIKISDAPAARMPEK